MAAEKLRALPRRTASPTTVGTPGEGDVIPSQKGERTSGPDPFVLCRTLVDPALRCQIATLPRSMRMIAGYHFGWWDRDGQPTPGRNQGKAVRPALTLLSALAVGGDEVGAVPAAVAIELVHNFSLLHDDVMDRDVERRHRPTAWTVFGTENAVLAGDALLALAPSCIAVCGEQLVQVLMQAVLELCDGQFADLAFQERDVVGLDECLEMANGKTASLLGAACQVGALAGGATAARARLLRDFGRHLGLAFQLVDDQLGIWGDPEVTGKPVHADLRARKKSLPVVAAMTLGSADGTKIAELYRSAQLSDGQLLELAGLIERAGGREWTQTAAEEQIEAATACLTAAEVVPGIAGKLQELANLVLSRKH
ncbi:polyprenyl synthetase family protein [Lentzea waywayandensis]|nr:polyprenyl synthetase family protein [Lentzea waywayandensis]